MFFGGRLAGLEVDDHQSAVAVPLEPVDLAPDRRPADRDVELDLDADQLAAVGGVPGEEPAEHVLRRLPLPLVGPAGTEVELVELGGQCRGRFRRRQPLGDLLGHGVDRRTHRPLGVRRRLGPDRTQHPPQRAALEGLDRRGPHPHRRRPRAPAGRRRRAAPAPTSSAGERARHALVGQPPEHRRRGRAALGRGLRIGHRAAQLGHQGGQRERARQVGGRPAVLRRRHHEVEEAGRRRTGVGAVERALHRGDDQPAAGPGARDVEQPPFLGQGEGAAVDRRCRRCRRPARPAPRCRAARCARAGRARRPPARRRRRPGPTRGPWRRAR